YTLPLGWGGPSVVTIHDLAHIRFAQLYPPGAGLYARIVAGLAARRARRVLTVSAHARSEVVELLGIPQQKVIVTHLAVSPGIRPLRPALADRELHAAAAGSDGVRGAGARRAHRRHAGESGRGCRVARPRGSRRLGRRDHAADGRLRTARAADRRGACAGRAL